MHLLVKPLPCAGQEGLRAPGATGPLRSVPPSLELEAALLLSGARPSFPLAWSSLCDFSELLSQVQVHRRVTEKHRLLSGPPGASTQQILAPLYLTFTLCPVRAPCYVAQVRRWGVW